MSTLADGAGDPGGAEPPSDDMLAAEYALGVLDRPQTLAAEARIAADSTFAGLAATWQRRLMPLAWELPPVEIPARVWTGIRYRLGWTSEADDGAAGYLPKLRFWRSVAAVAASAAVALLVIDVAPRKTAPPPEVQAGPPPQAPKPVTPLTQDDGSAGWLAAVDPRRGTVLMVAVPRAPEPQGRAAELWLIPPGQAPRSLGAVAISGAQTVLVPQGLRAELIGGAVLAVTLEPASGIPHTAPSGPIIAKGAIQL